MRIWRKRALGAAALALFAVAAWLALVPREEAPSDDTPVPAAAIEPAAPKRATFPLPTAKAPPSAPPGAEDPGDRTLCEACLPERAVLDVAKTYLGHLDPAYLQGEIWAHPLADVVPEKPGFITLPKLPADLVGAPAENPFGLSISAGIYPVETTWFVWVQTGWVPREAIERKVEIAMPGVIILSPEEADALRSGEASIRELRPDWQDADLIMIGRPLPDVALSWPPIKEEHYIAVDSRTGELRVSEYFVLRARAEDVDSPAHVEALELASARADDWFCGEALD